MAVTRFVLTVGTIGFPHVCDPAKFTAWVRYATSSRFDPDAWVDLPPVEANARCLELYRALGEAFKALNARPFGWAFYRDTWERVAGRLDPESWAWQGGTWSALATNAWIDAGGDPRDLDQSYLLELREDGFDTQRFWIRNDGSAEANQPPPPSSSGLQGSSRDLSWSEDTSAGRVRLRIVPSVYAYGMLARGVAGKLGTYAGSQTQIQNLVKEIRGDLEAKNFATAAGIGLTVLDLPGRAELLERQRVQEDRDRASQIAGSITGIAAAVSAIPGGVVVGAVLGAIAAVVALVGQFVGLARQWQRDVFYRAEPVFEVFRFNDEIDPALHRFGAGPPGWVEPATRPPLDLTGTTPVGSQQVEPFDLQWLIRLVPPLTDGEPVRVQIVSTRALLNDARVWIAGNLIPADRWVTTGAGEWRADVRLPPGEWTITVWYPGRRAHVERITVPREGAVELRPDTWPQATHPLAPLPGTNEPPPAPPPPPPSSGGRALAWIAGGLAAAGLAWAALAGSKTTREDGRR